MDELKKVLIEIKQMYKMEHGIKKKIRFIILFTFCVFQTILTGDWRKDNENT